VSAAVARGAGEAGMPAKRDVVRETPVIRPEPLGRCPICGTPHTFDEPVLCRACGEPVLLWGWAP
jgi:hypothetical protein